MHCGTVGRGSWLSCLRAQVDLIPGSYLNASRELLADFESVVGSCQISLEGMAYRENEAVVVNSASVFFPAAQWLRAFFHDAGTFVKSRGKGGPNGSLGVGCPNNNCGVQAGAALGPQPVTPGTLACANSAPPVSGFSDGKSYCCPNADQCIAKGQSSNSGPTPGLTIPVCLSGSQATVELCRRENDGLLSSITFFRSRQVTPKFMATATNGTRVPVSLADILVLGAFAAVKRCSGGAINVQGLAVGRSDASVADEALLPSVSDFTNDNTPHNAAFQAMGLNKNDMITLVTGSHSIGGFRRVSSPGQTDCPFTPFDCTPSGQFSLPAPPMDNSVFRVACAGVRGVSAQPCAWSTMCTNPAVDETSKGCPFNSTAREGFATCGGYPNPGLASDLALCRSSSTRTRMLALAASQELFFSDYARLLADLANLGYRRQSLMSL